MATMNGCSEGFLLQTHTVLGAGVKVIRFNVLHAIVVQNPL